MSSLKPTLWSLPARRVTCSELIELLQGIGWPITFATDTATHFFARQQSSSVHVRDFCAEYRRYALFTTLHTMPIPRALLAEALNQKTVNPETATALLEELAPNGTNLSVPTLCHLYSDSKYEPVKPSPRHPSAPSRVECVPSVDVVPPTWRVQRGSCFRVLRR